jgi:hypothetical protein
VAARVVAASPPAGRGGGALPPAAGGTGAPHLGPVGEPRVGRRQAPLPLVAAEATARPERGPAPLPLVAAEATVMPERGPGQWPVAGGDASREQPAPAVRSAAVTVPPEPAHRPGGPAGAAPVRVDVDRIADTVQRRLLRRLAVEAERRGLAR